MSSIRDETDTGPEDNQTAVETGQAEEEDVTATAQDTEQHELILGAGQHAEEDEEDEEAEDLDGDSVIARSAAQAALLGKESHGVCIPRIQEDDPFGMEAGRGPSSADGSPSTPDDTSAVQGSGVSSPGGRSTKLHSPQPSIRPFDRRFSTRLSSSPLASPRPKSPALLNPNFHSSLLASQLLPDGGDTHTPEAPWEVLRWTRLRKLSSEAFSETGKRNFGRPTCIAVSASIILGTSKGMILVFDYHQNLKTVIGAGTKAVESGSVTSIALSADHSTVAGGHANGSIFTWEISKSAKPFLYIPSTAAVQLRTSGRDGHVAGVAVVHIGFLGTRHTALVSADDKGMAFSHLTSRGVGALVRITRSTRILGRYPDVDSALVHPKKPSSVLAFSPLPLGVVEHATDNIGLVAILTPYLLVVVSTMPIAQTQYKAARPREVAAHGAMSAALAWYPSMKGGSKIETTSSRKITRPKLAYCWLDMLTVVCLTTVERDRNEDDRPPDLVFETTKTWKADESIVAMQWVSHSVLALITISQQLIILEDSSLQVTESSDLLRKHIYHVDLFSQQLGHIVERLDEDNNQMHGVVADAFFMSFKAYKGRLFLLGFNDVSIGTLSNWADRLLAMMEHGDFIASIRLATCYFNGDAEMATIGLPEDSSERHALVQEKLLEMMSASLRYVFGKNPEAGTSRSSESQLEDLAKACLAACLDLDELDFFFDDVYSWYVEGSVQGLFFLILENSITEGEISIVPPAVLRDLVNYFVNAGLDSRLEELLCRLNPETMDLDQISNLCKEHKLYDALFYVWNQAIGDYTTILDGLLKHSRKESETDSVAAESPTTKIFPYLSYILTGRVYPTGQAMPEGRAAAAKAEIYHFFFSGVSKGEANGVESFEHLRDILDLDASSFMSVLNEAFEDGFLNRSTDNSSVERTMNGWTEEQRFGLSLNRQYVLSILLDIMVEPDYGPHERIYLDMFIARNLAKFSQFILLPGSVLHRVLVELCDVTFREYLGDDCQLSVEYLLSVYHPPDLSSLIPVFHSARFYRVIKSIYRSERQYALLMRTCFEDTLDPGAIFECIRESLKPGPGGSKKQMNDVRNVIIEHTAELLGAGTTEAAATLDDFAPDLHASILDNLNEDEHLQFVYLREVLEPSRERQTPLSQRYLYHRVFIEQYVRLLCDYDPHHVSAYINQLKSGDLRLESVLPALESSGIVDAAVVLIARDGQLHQAISRLTQHLHTLQSALLGLLERADEVPDAVNSEEATNELLEGLEKYAQVGVWLCQRPSQAQGTEKTTTPSPQIPDQRRRYADRSGVTSSEDITAREALWLELIDAVVQVTRNTSEALQSVSIPAPGKVLDADTTTSSSHSGLLNRLHSLVQTTFTALLTATTSPSPSPPRFLPILRAFLSRASAASPSLAHLRGVLEAVFSAYAYEEGILSLANRLLEKERFGSVEKVAERRKRGWRPSGMTCQGCGARAWGPGVGRGLWECWLEQKQKHSAALSNEGTDSKGKGKATDGVKPEAEGTSDSLVAFACRHLYHRHCLEDVLAKNGDAGQGHRCPLEEHVSE